MISIILVAMALFAGQNVPEKQTAKFELAKNTTVSKWQMYSPSEKATINYELVETPDATMYVEEQPFVTKRALEFNGKIWSSVEEGGQPPQIINFVPKFPDVKKPTGDIVGPDGRIIFILLNFNSYNTDSELTPESMGVDLDTNIVVNTKTYGWVDGVLRPWAEHVAYIKSQEGPRGGSGPGFCPDPQECGVIFWEELCDIQPYVPCWTCTNGTCQNYIHFNTLTTISVVSYVPSGNNFCNKVINIVCYNTQSCSMGGITCSSNCDYASPSGIDVPDSNSCFKATRVSCN